MVRQYKFVSTWELPAPIERVWDVIADSQHWPVWWPAVTAVQELEPGEAGGLGNLRRYTFKGALPYALSFEMRSTRLEQPHFLAGRAFGQLEGEGRWYLDRVSDDRTVVRYEWDVHTNRTWMNVLAPLLRPFFLWNHDYVMDSGERGLRRYLAAGERAGQAG